jgi:hypothetical protein
MSVCVCARGERDSTECSSCATRCVIEKRIHDLLSVVVCSNCNFHCRLPHTVIKITISMLTLGVTPVMNEVVTIILRD